MRRLEVDVIASPIDRIPIIEAYEENVALYRQFAAACRLLVENLMTANDIKVHAVTCREKSVASLRKKVLLREKSYGALTDITDLAGARVVTYFEDDVDRVVEVIKREFDWDPANSIDKRDSLEPNQFGYVSRHLVCCLSSTRKELDEYRAFGGLVCEIQIRSILQHAWAEIEHDLGYKSASAVPRHLRREFSRLAALLEGADENFNGLRADLTEYESPLEELIKEDPHKVLLDQATLQAYIDSDKDLLGLEERLAGIVRRPLRRSEFNAGALLPLIRDIPVYSVGQLRNVLKENSDLIVKQVEIRYADREADLRGGWMLGGVLFDLWAVVVAENEEEDGLVARARKLELISGPGIEAYVKEVRQAVRQAKSGDGAT